MGLCNQSCRSGRSTVLRDKNFNVGHNKQPFQTISFIPAMLTSTIDLYHFIPLLVTMVLAGDHKVSTKQNLFASFSRTLFNRSG